MQPNFCHEWSMLNERQKNDMWEILGSITGQNYTSREVYVNHTPYIQNGEVHCHACDGSCGLETTDANITINETGSFEATRTNEPRIALAVPYELEGVVEVIEDKGSYVDPHDGHYTHQVRQRTFSKTKRAKNRKAGLASRAARKINRK